MSMVCGSRAAAGRHTWLDGKVYEGEWKDGKRNGKGEEREGGTEGAVRRRETMGRARAARLHEGGG